MIQNKMRSYFKWTLAGVALVSASAFAGDQEVNKTWVLCDESASTVLPKEIFVRTFRVTTPNADDPQSATVTLDSTPFEDEFKARLIQEVKGTTPETTRRDYYVESVFLYTEGPGMCSDLRIYNVEMRFEVDGNGTLTRLPTFVGSDQSTSDSCHISPQGPHYIYELK